MRASAELIQQLRARLTKSKSTLPRYKNLYQALRQQILDGLLLPGMCLPSSRVLAKQLGLARNTVLAAIEQLCTEGYVMIRPKSGVYVLSTAPVNWHINNTISGESQLSLSARGKKISERSHALIMRGDFAPGVPDLKQFPYELWQRYVGRYACNPKLDWQVNPYQGGIFELRQALADYLRIARGITCDAGQILITHGTQHSLRLIADLLTDPGDYIWMEDPGYPGARCVFDVASLKVISQPVDKEGISPSLNAWQKPPRFIYIIPSHQFPMGVVMSEARRRNLLELAVQHQTWIIEDDYDSEFRYIDPPLVALHALAPNQVIYLGTFSKIFFPSIRIGYMVIPEPLIDAFRIAQARHYREPSYVVQKALADFMRDGHISTHISKMRREYQARRDILIKLLRHELGDIVRLDGLNSGMHLIAYLRTNSKVSDQMIAAEADRHGIRVGALSRYYSGTNSSRSLGLILGFGDADQQDILRAGKLLSRIVSNFYAQAGKNSSLKKNAAE